MPPLKLPFLVSSICPKTQPQNLNQFLRTTAAQPLPARRPGWRITPCAPLAHFSAVSHDKAPLVIWKLGFRQFGGLRSSSEYRGGGVLGGESGGSGILADMGSENNNDKDEHWLDNDCSPDSALPSHNHHQDHRKKTDVAPPQPPHHQSTKLLTLPTILTIGRVAAVPLLVCNGPSAALIFLGEVLNWVASVIGKIFNACWWGTTATTSIFITAAITDWLDGYLARKLKLGSAFGAFLDPVADKLMVAATLVLLCTRPPEVAIFGQLPWLLTVPSIAIIGREITMSAVREWAASQNSKLSEAVAVNNLGKWKTATQMTALTILLATRDSSLAGPGVLVASGVTLLYISAWLAVWSLVVYMKKIWKVLLL